MGSKKEEGEDEMYGDSNMETYNTICKIESQWEFAVWLRKLKPGLSDNREGWMGKEVGGKIKEGTRVNLTVVLEKTWESLGLQGDPASPS